jgi:hypothetical protein
MSNLLSDYFPNLDQLSLTQIQTIRQRIVDTLASAWPQLDTRPNSVVGDLLVTPKAIVDAQSEAAMAMLLSDLDMSNVAKGIVYNSDFVTAFLANFGVTPLNSVPSSGVIALTFSTNKNYVLDPNAQITLGSNVFQLDPSAGNPVVIYSNDSSNTQNGANPWVLTQTDVNQYVVYLPVIGPSGASVGNGDVATYTLTQPELISISAAGDFDSGSVAETLPQMAVRAQQTFAAASLNNRSGAITFLNQRWPQMLGSAVTLTGDPEMLRAGVNPLGISDGAMDVFVKSQSQYVSGSSVIQLTYDATNGGWVGSLNLPVTAAFYSPAQGIFQTSNFQNSKSLNVVYSESKHPSVDSVSVAFSKYEKLGIFIVDTSPQNFQPSSVSAINEIAGTGVELQVIGEYASYYFNGGTSRSVTLRLESQTTLNGAPAISASVIDSLTGDTGTVYFVANSSVNPTGGTIVTGTYDYDRLLRGLQLTAVSPAETFNIGDYLGSTFVFSYTGRSASFNVNYLYDPSLIQVDSVLQDPDNHPIGVDVIVRSFMPCYISKMVVNYRIGYGNTLDVATAQANIFNYINSIVPPNLYEESVIGQIMLSAGALGLTSVSINGIYYPSLASNFVDKSGNISAVAKFPTTTLQVPANDLGVSANNVTYIINQATIQFNATVV